MKKILFTLFTLLLFAFTFEELDKKAEFKKFFSEYISTFSEYDLNKLQKIDSIPAFQAYSIDSTQFQIGGNKLKPTLLVFYATWCPSCKTALSEINESFNQLDLEKYDIIIVGREHSREELTKWKKEKDFKFDLVADTGRIIYSQFANKYVPRAYVIDKGGEILFQDFGWSDNHISMIKRALNCAE